MQKVFFLILFPIMSLLASTAHAVTFSILDEKENVIVTLQQEIKVPTSAGSASLLLLKEAQAQFGLDYEANENGIYSVGQQGSDIYVVSEWEIESYSWCYKVNGFTTTYNPKDVVVLSNKTNISWFYAYTLIRSGEQVDQCLPAKTGKKYSSTGGSF